MHRYQVVKVSEHTQSATPVTSFPRKKQALDKAWELQARARSSMVTFEVWDNKEMEFVE